jgi:hypothetical protein
MDSELPPAWKVLLYYTHQSPFPGDTATESAHEVVSEPRLASLKLYVSIAGWAEAMTFKVEVTVCIHLSFPV